MLVQLWLKSETEKARLFWTSQPGKQPMPNQVWIPRSVCRSILKYPYDGPSPWRRCDVEIEDGWLARNPLTGKPANQSELPMP